MSVMISGQWRDHGRYSSFRKVRFFYFYGPLKGFGLVVALEQR